MRFNLTILLTFFIYLISYPQIEEGAEIDFGKFFEVGGNLLTFPKDFYSDDCIKLSASIKGKDSVLLIDHSIALINESAFSSSFFSLRICL